MVTLDDLIKEGEDVKAKNIKQGMGSEFITGEDYERWIAKCILFFEKNYSNQTLTKRFIESGEKAAGNDVSYYNTMIGILKAYKEME